ncbi:hypothetical protein [Desulfatirhabdium butyrativorans]|uniref:hypothetical protein n=1 Tax=Desulfatirhabdium butyrativorans TaxID=340467 RepID=UPI00048458DA|nr:hypothetical protein [Desulfatirhabdium butyrativorans]
MAKFAAPGNDHPAIIPAKAWAVGPGNYDYDYDNDNDYPQGWREKYFCDNPPCNRSLHPDEWKLQEQSSI